MHVPELYQWAVRIATRLVFLCQNLYLPTFLNRIQSFFSNLVTLSFLVVNLFFCLCFSLSGGTRRKRQATASVPYSRLWESLRKNQSPQSASSLAHRRATFSLQMAVLWQAIYAIRRTAATFSHPHGGKTIHVRNMQQEIHAIRSSSKTLKNPRE